MASISFAITAYNEADELQILLAELNHYVSNRDEVVIQLDTTATPEVRSIIKSFGLEAIEFPLNKDFASFKNNLKDHCTKDYIFFIDADEYPSGHLDMYLLDILKNNPEVELYHVPRHNIVKGITQEHINKWGWVKDEIGRINYPDYQSRIIKNLPHIKWEGKVHERLVGAKVVSALPPNTGLDLYHFKDIKRQEKQNELYNTI